MPIQKATALREIVSSAGLTGNVEVATKFVVLKVGSVVLFKSAPGCAPPSPFSSVQLPSLDWRCCWRENISSAHSLRTSYICPSLILNQSKLWRIQSNVFNLKRPKQGAKGCDLLFTWASTLSRLLHDLVKIFSNYLTIIFQHRWTTLVGQFGNLMSFYRSTHGLNEMALPVTRHPLSLSPRHF